MSPTSLAVFQHDPLPSSEDHIRLVRFSSFSLSHPIRCSLTTSCLVPSPHYAAVSYTWGKLGGEREFIELNGKQFAVQKNLYEFLRALQAWREPRALWIDAICINQHRLQERNHQVHLMSTIFTKAAEVLVWLGPATDTSDEAMDFLRDRSSQHLELNEPKQGMIQEVVSGFSKAYQRAEKGLGQWSKYSPLGGLGVSKPSPTQELSHNAPSFSETFPLFQKRPGSSKARSQEDVKSHSGLGLGFWTGDTFDQAPTDYEMAAAQLPTIQPSSGSWTEVAELCRCEYWKRVWILQEVTLASKITIFCGSKRLPEVALTNAFSASDDNFWRSVDLRRRNGFPATPDTTMVDLRYSFAAQVLSSRKGKEPRTLVELLFQYQDSKCHDVRDKVFALLSLASDCTSESAIRADYGWDPIRLFFEVMSFCQPRNTTQFAVLLQNLLEIEPERPPRNFAQKMVRERLLSAGRQAPMIPIWASSTGALGICRLVDEMGRPFTSEVKCFEYPTQRAETTWDDNNRQVQSRHYVWFTKAATAKSGDRVYHLAGCPLAFIFREAERQLIFVGLAVLKKHQHWEVAQSLLQDLYVPESLPALSRSRLEREKPMANILVDYPTLIHSNLVLSAD